MRVAIVVAALGAFLCLPAASQATSVRGQAYGFWDMACPRSMFGEALAQCSIRFRSPRAEVDPSVLHMAWTLSLDAGGNAHVTSSGRSRTTCRSMDVRQEVRRNYRLTDETIELWRMEEMAERAYATMRSHIGFFGNCPREDGDSEPFPETLLEASQADFTRALIAAETRLRGRGPEPNGGSTTSANLAGVEFRGSQASLDRLAEAAVELDWRVDTRTARRLVVMPPPDYEPSKFNALLERIERMGLHDLDVRMIGPYGPARIAD